MLCLPVVCFLDYTHSPRQARVLGELTRCFKSGLSLPFSFQILLVPPYVLQSSSNGHLPFAKSTPPLITQWQSSGVHSASNPCLSCPTCRAFSDQKATGLIFPPPLTFNSTRGTKFLEGTCLSYKIKTLLFLQRLDHAFYNFYFDKFYTES